MPPPSTLPKASPPTPCTACSMGRSHASSCTPCSPEDGPLTTSTSRSLATATRTPSSDPTPSHSAPRPRSCSRSLPAMKGPSPPARCWASSTNPAPRAFQVVQRYTDSLHVAAEQLPRSPNRRRARPADQYVPGLTDEPAWPTLRAHLLAPRGRNRKAPTCHMMTAAGGRDQQCRRHGRRPLLAHPRTHAYQPRSAPLAPGHSRNAQCPSSLGRLLGKAILTVADLANQSKITSAKVTRSQSGHHREATQAPPSSAVSQCGGRQRHQSPRPATKRRRPT